MNQIVLTPAIRDFLKPGSGVALRRPAFQRLLDFLGGALSSKDLEAFKSLNLDVKVISVGTGQPACLFRAADHARMLSFFKDRLTPENHANLAELDLRMLTILDPRTVTSAPDAAALRIRELGDTPIARDIHAAGSVFFSPAE